MIYFRLCFGFRCCGYELTLIKKSHTLNFYSFFLLLVTLVAQFTAKATNSEKAIYFLSLISCSMNKLKSHLLFKWFYENFVFRLNVEKKQPPLPPLCPPLSSKKKSSVYSQENTFVGAFFDKVAGFQAWNLIKKRLQHRCLPVNIAKFLRTPILKCIFVRLLLKISQISQESTCVGVSF